MPNNFGIDRRRSYFEPPAPDQTSAEDKGKVQNFPYFGKSEKVTWRL